MATGGGRRGRKGDNNDNKFNFSNSALPLTVGAVVGAALLYGAKKLYDYVTTEDQPEEKEQQSSPVHSQRPSHFENELYTDTSFDYVKPHVDNKDVEACTPDSETASKAASSSLPTTPTTASPMHKGCLPSPVRRNLHDQLLSYYMNYVDVQESDMEEAYEVVMQVKYMFVQFLAECLPNHKLGELEDVGSTAEGMNVVRPEEFDISVPISLNPQMWELMDAGEAIMTAHGYKLVRRKNLEFFSPGSTAWDKYMMAGYLSPKKIITVLLELINKGVNWGSRYVVRPSLSGAEVRLDVQYGNQLDKHLAVYFIPTVTLEGTTVEGKPHPKAHIDPSFEHLWRESFAGVETAKLSSAGENGCQITCLMIMKAIRLNHLAQLGMLSSYVIKTVVLHLLDQEEDWAEASICERFLDILKALEDYLRSKNLPHYSCPYVNLLEGIHPASLESARNFITRVIGQNEFENLLKTSY